MFLKKIGFTLAEVLITLGIIGVVAAMTMPTLVSKYRQRALETAFKKTYSNLMQAYKIVIDEGYSVYEPNPTDDRPDGDPNFDPEFGRELRNLYRAQTLIVGSQKIKYKNSIKTYTKNKRATIPQCSQFLNATNSFISADGSVIAVAQNCGALWITLDTNGLNNGPNALGHDIFIFYTPKDSDKLVGATMERESKQNDDGSWSYDNTSENADKCSLTAKSSINGSSCAQFAIRNVCPYDSSKTYWECLP